jgi:putative DNA-invertase from lambdoid prophage Rac
LGAQLLSVLKPGDAIITTKLDRAFRNAADALATLEALKSQGISLHMIDLGGDVTAESERDRIREQVRKVKRHLASQMRFGGGSARSAMTCWTAT